jgi:plastocyanin
MRRVPIMLAVLAALTAVACSGAGSGGDVQPSDDGGPAITQSPAAGGCTEATARDLSGDDPFTVTAENLRFSPTCFIASGDASITIQNKDAVDHTFTIDGTQVDVPLPGNQTFNGEPAALGPGSYEFHCSIHGFSMSGTVIVV